MLKIGDKVRHKVDGDIGEVVYSSFGFSIHMWTEYNGQKCLAKTLGESEEEILKHWEKVEDEING